MRIVLVHNRYECESAKESWRARSNRPGGGRVDLREVTEPQMLSEIESIHRCLAEAGHDASVFVAEDATGLCEFLSKQRPDLIFNCCEGLSGMAALEMNMAALYELFGLPYTGSSALTLGLLLNKPLTKAILDANGVRTPAYVVIGPGHSTREACRLNFPLIVKPAAEDASIGIDDGAVVYDENALGERVRFVCREFGQAALVEEFIAGREFSVSLLAISPFEFTTLAICEIAFDLLPEDRPRILGYDAKWNPKASFTQGMATRCPAAIDEKTAGRIRRVSHDAARLVGLRDYGRVDLRLRSTDQALFVLEVNPNPDLSEDCAFIRAARASGRSYRGTICEIVERAVERHGRHYEKEQ